jgi:hypothetical protein
MDYASITAANRTNIESYPNRITGFPYESSLQLKVRDLPCCGGAALALTLFPIILMYDVEVAKPRQFLWGVSEHPGERRICLTQASIRISSRDSEQTLLEGSLESLLTVTERRFRGHFRLHRLFSDPAPYRKMGAIGIQSARLGSALDREVGSAG